mmetsp:Transcript_32428/g.47982  ORF Transcript_32428/g.47982 Transcript_32428/m.47982 type:complete len:344 (+) Transcript_32428:225-1256(+)
MIRLSRTKTKRLQLKRSKSHRKMVTRESNPPSLTLTLTLATFYVLSGVTQPLIMTLIKTAGLADPRAQIYMFFYYLGPSCVFFFVDIWPPPSDVFKICFIAMFDIGAQAMNYTGTTLAGPTIFAIIYSSVTVWTAIFSFIFLRRPLSAGQWWGVFFVFAGLCITGLQSTAIGPSVVQGTLMVFVGSIMHSLTYVMSESIMENDTVSVKSNCAIQGMVGSATILFWQFIYTRHHYEEVLSYPVQMAGTTWTQVAILLFSFGFSNFIHALCFFHTLRFCPGGATSAGVMKGLQAVVVFVFSSIVYCGRLGGSEMCFSIPKFISLLVVVGGVVSSDRSRCISSRPI